MEEDGTTADKRGETGGHLCHATLACYVVARKLCNVRHRTDSKKQDFADWTRVGLRGAYCGTGGVEGRTE